jgi:predicted flap endonuclease-1-like 5' DNA nuclease
MDSASSPPPVGAAAYIFQDWTVIVLIAIALLAVLVIAGMIWGQKKARERRRVEEVAEERAEEAGAELPLASPPPPLDVASGFRAEEPHPEPEPVPSPEPVAAVEPTPAPPTPIAARELSPEPVPEPAVEPEPEPEPSVTPQATTEPPAAEPPVPEPAPKPVAEPEKTAPAEPAAPAVDPEIAGALALTTIKGLGPKVAAMLAERGFTRVDQLAALSAEDASALDIQLGAFTGRMTRDRWIEQAKLLAAGDTAAYEAVFGKLG